MEQTDLAQPLRAGVKANFPCPNCGAKTGVINSPPSSIHAYPVFTHDHKI